MVVTAETCNGPRAYTGLVSAYHEQIEKDFNRLNDEEWKAQVEADSPADVAWMEDIVAE